ncbi:M81 family metallopeptidase [Yoonia sp. SS1-5]|uniref:M81 family metallopeptidase n=1 Tax=Yoonia rhodophyticola TaxID=3137370 RepID=A0AAN0MDF7_9RHOB
MKRVAVGGLHTECSSYAPLQQVAGDFTRTTGQALRDMVPFDFAAAGITLLPLFHDRSVPGGPVSATTFADQFDQFMAALHAAMPLDGVLLLMHGAMFVPGVDDPEGVFIRKVRDIVGPDAIISASFDLHGQVTDQICAALDGFAAYRTAPHVDVADTHARAARILADALNGGPRPVVHWVPIPILVPGEMSSTFVEPCRSLYATLPAYDRKDGICDSNLMIGYVWADSPRATAAAVVTATDPDAGRRCAKQIAQAYQGVRDRLVFDMQAAALPAALDAVAGRPAILADSGDNPTAGGMGDRADVLYAVQRGAPCQALFAGIADPAGFAALSDGAVEVTTGGTLGGGGPRVTLAVENCRIVGDCAIVQTAAATVVLTARRRPFHNLSDFSVLGLALDDFDLLVVKSGYLSPDLRTLPRFQIMALTEGAVCQNLAKLENNHRPRDTWPFCTFGPKAGG